MPTLLLLFTASLRLYWLQLSCYVDSDSLARDFVATVGGQAIGKVVGELMTLGVIFILLQMILR